jgi:hypothetical protein
MVSVSIVASRAVFKVEGLHKLWVFRSELEIPLTHITDAEINPDQARRWWHGIKLLGTDVPPVFVAGPERELVITVGGHRRLRSKRCSASALGARRPRIGAFGALRTWPRSVDRNMWWLPETTG